MDFSVTYSFKPYHGPKVDSALGENEYQGYILGVKAAGVFITRLLSEDFCYTPNGGVRTRYLEPYFLKLYWISESFTEKYWSEQAPALTCLAVNYTTIYHSYSSYTTHADSVHVVDHMLCYSQHPAFFALSPSSENAIFLTESELEDANFNICVHGSKTHLTLQRHLGARYGPSSHAAAVSPPCGRESIWALYKFQISSSWAVVDIKSPAYLKS